MDIRNDRDSSRRTRKVKDKEVVKVVEEIKKVGVNTLKRDEWEIEEELVLKEGKIYILKDEELKVEVI